jgi:hypothetical protein
VDRVHYDVSFMFYFTSCALLMMYAKDREPLVGAYKIHIKQLSTATSQMGAIDKSGRHHTDEPGVTSLGLRSPRAALPLAGTCHTGWHPFWALSEGLTSCESQPPGPRDPTQNLFAEPVLSLGCRRGISGAHSYRKNSSSIGRGPLGPRGDVPIIRTWTEARSHCEL